MVTFLIVSAALLAFAAGLILGAAVGSGKARDAYDAGYAAGLRELGGGAVTPLQLTHEEAIAVLNWHLAYERVMREVVEVALVYEHEMHIMHDDALRVAQGLIESEGQALAAKQRETDKWYAVAVELATRIDRAFLSDHMGFDPPTVARALDEEVYRTIAEAEIAWEEKHRTDTPRPTEGGE